MLFNWSNQLLGLHRNTRLATNLTRIYLRARNMCPARSVSLKANPSQALVDDNTRYFVQGLGSKEHITLAAVLKEGTGTFISHAHYEANQQGVVDLTTQPSVGGSYTGIEPMGLLWAMKPQEGSREGIRLMKRDVTTPFDINLSVLTGHQEINHCDMIVDCLCTLEHPRAYMAPGVKRIPVRDGKLRGTLFLPAGDGPYPGVIDLFGTAGGLMEFRSALFASRGFASLALAYFDFEDLPKGLRLDMEYFEEAVDWMISNKQIKSGGIGAIGVSKGTELVMYMGIYSPHVTAVVPINPYHYYTNGTHYKGGQELPTVAPNWEELKYDPEGLVIEDCYIAADITDDALIPIEETKNAQFLFINGEDDRCTRTVHADILMERLRKHGKTNFQMARYPKAGHLIEPPYTPHSRTAFHKLVSMQMLFGGSTKEHSFAQEDSWNKILHFFENNVGKDSGIIADISVPLSKV